MVDACLGLPEREQIRPAEDHTNPGATGPAP